MDLPELQQAIRDVPGVAEATMRWTHPDDPVVLRVSFTAAADRAEVSERVLDLVQQAGAVDPESIEVSPGPAAPAPRALLDHRPVLVCLEMRDEGLDTSVRVDLQVNGRRVSGQAEGVAAPGADLRMAATATLDALRHVLPGDVRVDLEWLGLSAAGSVEPVSLVQAGITCVGATFDPQWLYGSAPVRGDARAAAVRATLDALNRRLAHVATAS